MGNMDSRYFNFVISLLLITSTFFYIICRILIIQKYLRYVLMF